MYGHGASSSSVSWLLPSPPPRGTDVETDHCFNEPLRLFQPAASIALLRLVEQRGSAISALFWLMSSPWAHAQTSPAPAAQRPIVRVRADTRMELRSERNDSELTIVGVLRDDLGQPLASRTIRLELRAETRQRAEVRTSNDGTFEWTPDALPHGEGVFQLRAGFAGDELHRGLEVEREIELARAEVRLVVELEAHTLDLDEPMHTIGLHARSALGGGSLQIELLDELNRRLASGVTTADGDLAFEVPSSQLGAAGPGRLRARTDGGPQRAAAQTEVPILRIRPTALTLESSHAGPVRVGERLELQGHLSTSQGPVVGRAVGIFLNDAHSATVLTDAQGHYQFASTLGEHHGPRVAALARFATDSPGLPSAESSRLQITTAGKGAGTWLWSALVFLIGLGLVGLLRRRGKVATAAARPVAPPKAGVVAAQPRSRQAATLTHIKGRALDHRTGRPITIRISWAHPSAIPSGATEALAHAEPTSGPPSAPAPGHHQTPPDGVFEVELAPGTWNLRFESPAYAPLEQQVEVPHRGEWSNIQVRLESWRTRALTVFERVVAIVLPTARWERLTIRQAGGRGPAPVRDLAHEVERHVYGAANPLPEDVATVQARADKIVRTDDDVASSQPR